MISSRARHDQRNGDGKTDREQHEIALRSCSDRDDVVEAHDDVGNDDDPDRAPQMRDGLDFVFVGGLPARAAWPR